MSKSQSNGDVKRPKDSLKRADSYQWPAGHLSHLSDAQLDALARFKSLAQEEGYYSPGDAREPPSHDDETLLRYLRARKFVPQDAFGQLKDTEDWRAATQLDTLYETIDVAQYDDTRRLYPQWTGRRDKRGIPFYVFEVAAVDAKAVAAQDHGKNDTSAATSNTPRRMMRLFALYENLCRFVFPLCSAIPNRSHPETPISQSNNIVDISKVSLAKMWSLRNHMSDASKLATAHYPETLDHIFVIGAPSFFPTVWEWAKRWFDPITVSKIFILTEKNMTATLAQYVDLDNIPKKYGGNLDWKFGDMPNLDPSIIQSLQWKERCEENGHQTLPFGPIRWQYDDAGDLVAIAIGSENGRPRNREIARLHPAAGVARLALSPGRPHLTLSNPAASTPKSPAPTANGAPTGNMSSSNTTNADLLAGKTAGSAVPNTSRAGTYTVAARETQNDNPDLLPTSRQGTSATRYAQQDATHAEGTVADGTPEVKVDGQGERQGIMDPNTVGQAPKEHPLPPDPNDVQQQGVLEKAQQAAGQAYTAAAQGAQHVLSAVGMGGKTEDAEKVRADEGPKRDPEIDTMEGKTVEEFLRSQTMSASKPPAR